MTSNSYCQIDVLEELVADTFDVEHPTILCESNIAQSKASVVERTNCVVHLAKQPIGKRH